MIWKFVIIYIGKAIVMSLVEKGVKISFNKIATNKKIIQYAEKLNIDKETYHKGIVGLIKEVLNKQIKH